MSEAVRQGCLAVEPGAKLARWFTTLPNADRGEALNTATGAYQCLLQKKVAPQSYACFRQTIRERLYASFRPEELCLRDRLARALVGLRQLAMDSSAAGQLDMNLLDGALNDFLAGNSACRVVRQSPGLETSIRLAELWCVDIGQPSPPVEFTVEFIDTLARIAAANPAQGRRLGAVLGAVLRDARAAGLDAQALGTLNNAYQLLIELDEENLAGTSHFYLLRQDLARLIPWPDWAELDQIHALLRVSDDLERRLDTGAERLQNRASAWKPYEEYSDLLQDLAAQIRPDASERAAWGELNRRASRVLRRGIDVSAGTDAQSLMRIQEKLVERVRAYGLELGRAAQYRDVVDFESGFLDSSGRVLAQSQQCYVHAHLAQAYYALGDNRQAMEHFGLSCATISLDDLKRLHE